MPDTITSFRGAYRFLSNFYQWPVLYRGLVFPTSEHAYQWEKPISINDKNEIFNAPTPSAAKRLANSYTKLPNWDEIKLPIMEDILRAKFMGELSSPLDQWLLNTSDAFLIEGNTWGDRYWGQVNGEGENYLGLLLMKIRAKIKSLSSPTP